MASKKELMSFGKGQKQKVHRRGRVERSAAGVDSSLTGFTRADQAGASQSAEVATFLGEVIKTVPGAVSAWNKQANIDNEKKVQSGVASFKNANPKQRKKFRDAIWSGELEPDESPYFREGLQIAQTDSLTHRYGPDLFVAYENWEGKNSSDPKDFDKFIGEFNEGYRQDLNSIDDGIKKDHFWPKQTALISQLASQHQQKAAENYRKSALLRKSESNGENLEPGPIVETDNASNPESLETLLYGERREGILHSNVERYYEELASGKKEEYLNIAVADPKEKMLIQSNYPSIADIAIKVGQSKPKVLDPEKALFVDNSTVGIQESDSIFEDIFMGRDLPIPYASGEKSIEPKPLVADNKKVKKPKSHMEEVVSQWVGPDKTRDQHGLVSYGTSPEGMKKVADFSETIKTDLDAWGFGNKAQAYVVSEGKFKGQLRIQFGKGVSEEDQASIWTKIAESHKIGLPSGSQKTIKKSNLHERVTYGGET